MKPPIADPFEMPDSEFSNSGVFDEKLRIFPVHLWRVFFHLIVFSVVCNLPGFLFFYSPIYIESRLPSIIFRLVVIPILGTLVMAFFPVKMNPWGIYGPSKSGFVSWSQMKSAGYFWLGQPFVVISIDGQSGKWGFPWALRDPQGFARTIEEWAPADNPLRLFLQKRGF